MSEQKKETPKNPTREIFFFKNDSAPMVYVFMSLHMSVDEFYEMFEHAVKITEDEADLLVIHKEHKVVYVGDNHIIDKYFKDETETPNIQNN
jgi:hypothetical protein